MKLMPASRALATIRREVALVGRRRRTSWCPGRSARSSGRCGRGGDSCIVLFLIMFTVIARSEATKQSIPHLGARPDELRRFARNDRLHSIAHHLEHASWSMAIQRPFAVTSVVAKIRLRVLRTTRGRRSWFRRFCRRRRNAYPAAPSPWSGRAGDKAGGHAAMRGRRRSSTTPPCTTPRRLWCLSSRDQRVFVDRRRPAAADSGPTRLRKPVASTAVQPSDVALFGRCVGHVMGLPADDVCCLRPFHQTPRVL